MTDAVAAALRAPSRAPVVASDEPLALPDAWTPPSRAGVPILAAVVPVVGAVAIWLVTGSVLALWLAALGPLVAGATMLDHARSTRRERRRAAAAAAVACEAVAAEVARRHDAERRERWSLHPDVSRFLTAEAELWRSVPGRAGTLVVGAGATGSSVRVSGGTGDPQAASIRAAAAVLDGAPLVVPADAGVSVAGDELAADGVLRGLVLQLCLSAPPGTLRIVGPLRGENAWAEALPHRRAVTGRALAIVGPGEGVPDDAELILCRGDDAARAPHCAVSIRVRGLDRGSITRGTGEEEASLEAVGLTQARAIASWLADRADAVLGPPVPQEPLAFADVFAQSSPHSTGLQAALGTSDAGLFAVDLVADGPHAVVAGVTGSGKSELLTTWILGLCAAHPPTAVSFLLADFKGGTAFDALAGLPHVTGVITDLDGAGAHRAIQSLRAEVRWRESALAAAGVRDIGDPRVGIPRLVIVVDEFAALLADQPELHAVFTDVAARGRALGMHLVLGTQRIAGVIRESLLANCPLRLSLRVTDRGDSRSVVGTDAAAEIPGGVAGRGVAVVRRAADPAPTRIRVALSREEDVAAVTAVHAAAPAPRRPWLPALADRVDLGDLAAAPRPEGALVLGLADEPDHQRQPVAALAIEDRGLLIVGGPGSGRTTAVRSLAAQAGRRALVIPADPEEAWDVVAGWEACPPEAGTVVLADDLDALLSRYPTEYAQQLAETLERLARESGYLGILVVAAVQRLVGPATRIADMLPRRLVLRMPARADHLAAGGDPALFSPHAPPGRGVLDGTAVHVAVGPSVARPRRLPPPVWVPASAVTGFVTRRSPGARAAESAWRESGLDVITVEEYTGGGVGGAGPVVVSGDPDDWQRSWRVLAEFRAERDLVVDASCGAELRMLAGIRSLPPFAEPGRGRAWLISAGDTPVRIVLPAAESGRSVARRVVDRAGERP